MTTRCGADRATARRSRPPPCARPPPLSGSASIPRSASISCSCVASASLSQAPSEGATGQSSSSTVRIRPPVRSRPSMSVTSCPASARKRAARTPAMPAPITKVLLPRLRGLGEQGGRPQAVARGALHRSDRAAEVVAGEEHPAAEGLHEHGAVGLARSDRARTHARRGRADRASIRCARTRRGRGRRATGSARRRASRSSATALARRTRTTRAARRRCPFRRR